MLNILRVKYKPFEENKVCIPPSYATEHAAGADLTALDDYTLNPKSVTFIPTNLAVEIPVGYELQVRPRSGFSSKKHVMIINSPGTIDSDYRGEIKVALFNPDTFHKCLQKGQKFAQLVLAPVLKADFVLADELSDTERGEGGFGSTDKMPILCARCTSESPLFPPACKHKPEHQFGPTGMYHCPDCGTMLLAGSPHFYLCEECNKRILDMYAEEEE